ncbi:hypothetical protein C7212DRAFT_194875, partial [Tuber magnatum]
EDHLTRWCLLQASLDYLSIDVQIKALGHQITSKSDDGQPFGREWCHSFLNYHLGLKT